jgi:hypothetical protein
MTGTVLSIIAALAVLILVLRPYIGQPGGLKPALKIIGGGALIAGAMVLAARLFG